MAGTTLTGDWQGSKGLLKPMGLIITAILGAAMSADEEAASGELEPKNSLMGLFLHSPKVKP